VDYLAAPKKSFSHARDSQAKSCNTYMEDDGKKVIPRRVEAKASQISA
jgi:hypothetical protein